MKKIIKYSIKVLITTSFFLLEIFEFITTETFEKPN